MSTTPFNATQMVAGVAIVTALLGGAYAVGRSQSADRAPDAPLATEPSARAGTPRAAHDKAAVPLASEAPGALCAGCARVTEVRTETRRGEASGVGVVGGAVVGGLLGNMVGGGNGRKLATVGGAVAGGYAGNEIEKNQKSHTVWVLQMRDADGRLRQFERRTDPGLRVGDEVQLTEQGFTRR